MEDNVIDFEKESMKRKESEITDEEFEVFLSALFDGNKPGYGMVSE